MGLDHLPEIKIAQRFVAKHSLTIPYDLEKLIGSYATLIYKKIPIEGIDGVSINLKIPGKTPKIIVNSLLPKTRQYFTLAHELGHIIIPWHIGTIADEIYPQQYRQNYYSHIEQEANRFAAELLMPKDWVIAEYKNNGDDIAQLHCEITEKARVSFQAASIRLLQILPANYIFVASDSKIVSFSGKTSGTYAFLQDIGLYFDKKFYPYFDHYSSHNNGNMQYHWWKISSKLYLEEKDDRPWRVLLDEIAHEINPPEGIEKFKKSVSSVMAYAHGNVKLHGIYSIDSVIAASIYRLRRSEFKEFVSHPAFENFVKVRVKDFFNK